MFEYSFPRNIDVAAVARLNRPPRGVKADGRALRSGNTSSSELMSFSSRVRRSYNFSTFIHYIDELLVLCCLRVGVCVEVNILCH